MTTSPLVHPTAVIGAGVVLGEHVQVGPYAVLQGTVTVGTRAVIGAHCVIGGAPKVKGYDGPIGEVVIGEGTVVSELCAVDAPTGSRTELGAQCYIMPHCYVGHDCRLGKGVTLTAGCELGGHVWIGDHATFGLGTVVHQFSAIGAFVMVGMASVVNRDVPPFAMVRGNPARRSGTNRVGLKRAGFAPEEIDQVAAALSGWAVGQPWPSAVGRDSIATFSAASRRPPVK